jgi:hypothetical protein
LASVLARLNCQTLIRDVLFCYCKYVPVAYVPQEKRSSIALFFGYYHNIERHHPSSTSELDRLSHTYISLLDPHPINNKSISTHPRSAMVMSKPTILGVSCDAFQQCPPHLHRQSRSTNVGYREAATARAFREEKQPNHFLLDEFKTHSGEIIDPYQTLKVPREAERTEVRKAYITLSKRYHPDGSRHRDVLPGRW